MFETSAINVSPTAEPRPRWKHGSIPVIGLIGGVGGGKSAAAALLAARGAVVIDADAVGHRVLERPEVRDRLVARFGPDIVAAEGASGSRVDRRALAKIVFADRAARRDLEAVVHPLMVKGFERTIAQAERSRSATAVALDAAVLLEAGWERICDLVVYIDAPRADRLERAVRTRGWSPADFEAREAAQLPCEEKRRRADYVLPNIAGPGELAVEVDRFRAWLAAPPDPSCLRAAEH